MTTTNYRGTDRSDYRTSRVVLLILASVFVVFGFSATALATVPDTTTQPTETTEPPNTEAPGDTVPDNSAVPSNENLEEEDEGVNVAPIAIVGFILVLAIASWWMIRRDDADDRPSPPPTGEPEWRADQIAP